jgi:hypothetical protein
MAVSTTGLIVAGVIAALGATATVHNQNMANKSLGTAQNRANQAQIKQLEVQAAAEKTQATADELERQRTLQRILATQTAVFGSSGLDPSSASLGNIQTSDSQKAAEARNLNQIFSDTRQVGLKSNMLTLDYNSAMTRQAGKFTRRANTINGINSIIKIGSSTYSNSV